MDAPPVITSEGEVPNGRVTRENLFKGALTGTSVSGDVVEGIARVICDPLEETIETGEILVAPSSDPGWTPLFLNTAGMVVEVGGRMSHSALIAREYGLPSVVSVLKQRSGSKPGSDSVSMEHRGSSRFSTSQELCD